MTLLHCAGMPVSEGDQLKQSSLVSEMMSGAILSLGSNDDSESRL